MNARDDSCHHSRWRAVWICGTLIVVASGLMAWQSRSFSFDSDPSLRPLGWFVVLMSSMFLIHWIAFRSALALGDLRTTSDPISSDPISRDPISRDPISRDRRRLVILIWFIAIAARLSLLPSQPIQEVDLYRYLWDGQTTIAGVSPFRYAPATVVAAIEQTATDQPLAKLSRYAAEHPSIETILRRVHFSELPTVYPSVSQSVFAAVAALTPTDAAVSTHRLVMKTAIVCFDLGTLAVMFWLLGMTRLPIAWAITYAWNPLALKEFAGSGHLDSIAIFFTIASVAFAVRAMQNRKAMGWMASGTLLALGFGAKLYPIVLLPVLIVGCFRSSGAKPTAAAGLVFTVVAGLTLVPLRLATSPPPSARQVKLVQASLRLAQSSTEIKIADELIPPVPDPQPTPQPAGDEIKPGDEIKTGREIQAVSTRPTEGIETFLTRWEMNDLVFLLLVENLRPGETNVWFCLTPQSVRDDFSFWSAGRLQFLTRSKLTSDAAAFIVARMVTLLLFVVVLLWLVRGIDPRCPAGYCRVAFLVLATFWVCSPTLNPWYWIWALPLVPFAKNRGWILVSGMLTLYYFRFWFIYHAADPILAYAPYRGVETFDLVVVFFEHLPWMLLVAYLAFRARTLSQIASSSGVGETLRPS